MDVELLVAVLPFISFEEKIIRFRDFTLFADSEIESVEQLSEGMKTALRDLSENQKQFITNQFKNSRSEVTFLIPNSSGISERQKSQLEAFLEILFFYFHRGPRFAYNLLGTPNPFCREDFKYAVFQLFSDSGRFVQKWRFKFRLWDSARDLVITPQGCENVVTGNEDHGYPYKDIAFNYQDEIFHYLYEVATTSKHRNLLRSISYFNKSMSCQLTDDERFVWLSAALQSFFEIGNVKDIGKVIKQNTLEVLKGKTFTVLTDRNNYLNLVGTMITVIYNYRSLYVHGSERQIDDREKFLSAALGKMAPVIALMSFLPTLFLHNKLSDDRIESVLNAIFNSQKLFERAWRIYGDSADHALEKLRNFSNVREMLNFAHNAQEWTISFDSSDKKKVEKCLDNILFIFAKFARGYPNLPIARQIQEQINSIDFKDPQKFEKWNTFFAQTTFESTFLIAWETLVISHLVYRKLFAVLAYEYVLF